MWREFYDSDCPACGGDGVSPYIERPLPPYAGLYRPCSECRGTGKKRIPLMWQHPLLASNMDNWRKPATESPVVRGCVIQVDQNVTVTFHCRNRLRPATEPTPATLSVTTQQLGDGEGRSREMKWKIKLRLVEGHRYFEEIGSDCKPTGKIGVADDSGANPSVTDDGVLYVDSDRHVCIDNWDGGSRIQALVPVVKPNGQKLHVMERPERGLAVASAFGLEVNIRGSMVNVLHSFDQLVKSRPGSVHFPEYEGEGHYTMWKDRELNPSQEPKS